MESTYLTLSILFLEMYKKELTLLATVVFVFALLLTGLGGFSDMIGTNLLVSKQHAWNDGIFLILVAIFLLGLARL